MKKLDIEQKYIIAKDYLIPQLCDDIGFNKDDLIISDSVIDYIINNYTKEDGVRELKRCLENIISRLNILKFTNNSKKLNMSFDMPEFKLPLELTIDILTYYNFSIMVHVKYAFADQPPLKAPLAHTLKETPETSPA